MKKTTIKACSVIAAVLLATGMQAQQTPKKFGKPVELVKCGTTEYETLLQQKNPARANTIQFEKWLAPKVAAQKAQRMANLSNANAFNTNEVVTIPVVVHVIHSGIAVGTDENIANEQILSQITVLNQDFRKLSGTPGANTNPIGADAEIEFCMAQRDPNGIATNGIVRYAIGTEQPWEMDEFEVIKAQTQWNPEKYLNIWVVNGVTIGGFALLAGYAQFPVNSGLDGLSEPGLPTAANTDGVVIAASCFGSSSIYPNGFYEQNRDKGRTASHEIGHFFGLRHIWGDGNNCTSDDFCADTPIAFSANSGCPSAGFDSCPTSPGNDMFQNYMDYTDDACQNIFTLNQKDRMMAVLENSPRRASLTTSDGCQLGIVYDNDGSLNIQGTTENCSNVFTPSVVLTNTGNNTLTTVVINYSLDDNDENTYTWEGTLTNGQETNIDLPSITTTQGEHTFNVYIVTVNGVEDELPANDDKSQNFTVVSSYETTQVIVTILTDDYGDETLWAIVDSNDNPIATNANFEDIFESDFYNSNQLYTIPVDLDPNQCYTFGILDLAGDGICCEYGNGYYSVETAEGVIIAEGGEFTTEELTNFRIGGTAGVSSPIALSGTKLYPNPANNVINIAVGNSSTLPDSYTVYNNLGQVMDAGKVSSNNQVITISGYATGVYFVKLNSGNATETLQFIKY